MHMHVVKNAPFEGPGLIASWAAERGAEVSVSSAIAEKFVPLREVDFLVVMGGPMAADDHVSNPWLAAEKRYVASAMDAGCRVLGVCLGAQVLADAAGGAVGRNGEPEIGFYPLMRSSLGDAEPVFSAFRDGMVVGHWHGDTFSLPPGAHCPLSSAVTANQAFSLDAGRIVGLQFHAEWTSETVRSLVDAAGGELAAGGRWVSSASALLEGVERHGPACRRALWDLLDRMMIAGEEGR